MDNKVEIGAYGQKLAEDYLTANGFGVMERNFRCRSGEIDIIARDGEYIAFVEVKYRRGLAHGYPREAVGYYKQRHIRHVAQYYIMYKRLNNQDFRFDVLEIIDLAGKPEITLIKNAF
ncbi:MAG: YraN family protein [Clostridiales bacterium]|jgi:putative endonuclease|nr:YraN family protein [Clostridiales bacterium]